MLLNMASLDLHHKEALDMSLFNMSLLSEVTFKSEDKLKERVDQFKNRVLNLNEVPIYIYIYISNIL